jgi:uncharacterized delta-60 repeat protein
MDFLAARWEIAEGRNDMRHGFDLLKRTGWKAGLLAVISSLLLVSLVLAAGQLDLSFSQDGRVTTDWASGSDDDNAYAVAVQSNGKIVAAGQHTNESMTDSNFAVARYNSNGSLDTNCIGDGKLTTNLGAYDKAFDVAIQPDGKIVVVGDTCINVDTDLVCDVAIVRYRPGGSLDTTFSGDGKQIIDFAGQTNGAEGGLAIQSDGKIVFAGFVVYAAQGNSDFAVYRLNSDGSLDTAFGGHGRVSFDFGNATWSDIAQDLAVQSNGKIVVGGYIYDGISFEKFAVARLNTNGSPDTTFSGDGRQTTTFANSAQALSLALQADGKIVLAGVSSGRFALARYKPGGALDQTFGGDGRVTTRFFDGSGGETEAICWDVAVLSTGKLVAVGEMVNTSRDFAIARYNSNGTLDTGFGRSSVNFGDYNYDIAFGLAVQPNGRYVLAGVTIDAYESYFALARFMP